MLHKVLFCIAPAQLFKISLGHIKLTGMADLVPLVPAAEGEFLFCLLPHKFKFQGNFLSYFRRYSQSFQSKGICCQFSFLPGKPSLLQSGKTLVQLFYSACYPDFCLSLFYIFCNSHIDVIGGRFYQRIICDLFILFPGNIL